MGNSVQALLAHKAKMTAKSQQTSDLSSHRKAQLWTIVLLAGLIPLPFTSVVDGGHDLPKVTLLLIGVTFLALLWVRSAVRGRAAALPHKTVLVLALLTLLSLAVSTALSINPLRSLIGDSMRVEGAVVWVAYLLLFLFASSMDLGRDEVKLIIGASLAGASIASILGIVQFAGIFSASSAVKPEQAPFELYRAYSSFGNPMTFGQYLALLFPIALVFSLQRGARSIFLSVIPAALIGITLVFTFTRAAWVSVAFSLVVLLGMLWPKLDAKARRTLFAGIAVLVMCAGVILGVVAAKDPGIMTRFSPATILSGSAETRLRTYDVALTALSQRPVFGYGIENFGIAFVENRGDAYVAAARFKEVNDRAHNVLFDLAVSGGLVFLLLLGALVVLVLVRSMRSARSDLMSAGLLAGSIGYILSLQLGFSVPGSTAVFFIFLGILANRAMGAVRIPVSVSATLRVVVPGVAAVVAGGLMLAACLPLASMYYYVQGEQFRRADSLESAVENYEKAASIFPWYQKYYRSLAQTYAALYVERNYGEKAIIKAKQAYDTSVALDPYDRDALFYSGLFYFVFNDVGNGALNKSIDLLERNLELDHYSIPARLVLADAYDEAGRARDAQGMREDAIEMASKFGWLDEAELQETLKEAAKKLKSGDPDNHIAAKYFRMSSR